MVRALILILAAAACASPQAITPGETELEGYIRGRVAGPPQNCIPIISRREGLRAVDRRTLVYRSGETVWINRLEEDCPGLRPLATLAVDTLAGRYCRGDSVRTFEAGATIPRAVCALGEFTPYRRSA